MHDIPPGTLCELFVSCRSDSRQTCVGAMQGPPLTWHIWASTSPPQKHSFAQCQHGARAEGLAAGGVPHLNPQAPCQKHPTWQPHPTLQPNPLNHPPQVPPPLHPPDLTQRFLLSLRHSLPRKPLHQQSPRRTFHQLHQMALLLPPCRRVKPLFLAGSAQAASQMQTQHPQPHLGHCSFELHSSSRTCSGAGAARAPAMFHSSPAALDKLMRLFTPPVC